LKRYVHWVAYPVLIAIILYLTYAVVDQAVWLDDMQEGSRSDSETIDALLRFVSVDSPCDKTPKQLASAMGKLDYVVGNDVVAYGAFQATYEGSHLVSVEDVNNGKVAVCKNSPHQ